MNNIYCKSGKLTSWCTRILIELYISGYSATYATKVLNEGYELEDDLEGNQEERNDKVTVNRKHLEPSSKEMSELLNKQLLETEIFDSFLIKVVYLQILYPEHWAPIKISRVTVNNYYNKLGMYLWKNMLVPDRYNRNKLMEEKLKRMNKITGKEYDTPWTSLKHCEQILIDIGVLCIKAANNTSTSKAYKEIENISYLPFLMERAKTFNGLSIEKVKEHVSWAYYTDMVSKIKNVDNRIIGAALLCNKLIDKPL